MMRLRLRKSRCALVTRSCNSRSRVRIWSGVRLPRCAASCCCTSRQVACSFCASSRSLAIRSLSALSTCCAAVEPRLMSAKPSTPMTAAGGGEPFGSGGTVGGGGNCTWIGGGGGSGCSSGTALGAGACGMRRAGARPDDAPRFAGPAWPPRDWLGMNQSCPCCARALGSRMGAAPARTADAITRRMCRN